MALRPDNPRPFAAEHTTDHPGLQTRRLETTRRSGGAGDTGIITSFSRECSTQSAGTGRLDRRQNQSTYCKSDRQSHLATVFWCRIGNNAGGFRDEVRKVIASRTARLAGAGIYRKRLEHQTYSPADCELGGLSPILEDYTGSAGKRPVKRLVGACAAYKG